MKVSWRMNPDRGEHELQHVRTITIELEDGDDPAGHINGLLLRERLGPWLLAYADPGGYGLHSGSTNAEVREVLMALSFVAGMSSARLEGLMVAARDTWGLSWGRIAEATEQDRATTRRHIISRRLQDAAKGYWRDALGLHSATPEDATQHAGMAGFTDELD